MQGLTRWVIRHKISVVVMWVILTVSGFAVIPSLGSHLSTDFRVPGSEGYATNTTIANTFSNGGNVLPVVPVITLPPGVTMQTRGVEHRIAEIYSIASFAIPGIRIASFADAGGAAFISPDQRTTYALVFTKALPGYGDQSIQGPLVEGFFKGFTVAGVHFHFTGRIPLELGGGNGVGPGVLLETLIGAIGALAVLAFVFASFLAAIPLLVAAVTIPVTLLIVFGLTHFTEVSFLVEFLVSMIGLGVAIDYALLIVTRWREECAKGADPDTALIETMRTAGRSVAFSGITVAIGLLAMVVLPIPFLRSLGIAGMLIPLVSVAVSITLLPVFLARFGQRADWPKRTRGERASRMWSGWARLVVRFRWVAAIAGIAILAVLIWPATQLRLGNPTASSLGGHGNPRAGLTALEQSGLGPGVLTPFEVLVQGTDPVGVATALAAVPGVSTAFAPLNGDWHRDGYSIVDALPSADGTSPQGAATLTRIRAVAHRLPGTVSVGGWAAQDADFVAAAYHSFPLMLTVIMILTFLVLARVFGSLILAVKAILLNLLSVAAAIGVMVWVWQTGHGSHAIWGVSATGSIIGFIPLMTFAFLFGISMDYEVFIMSRIREEYDSGATTSEAVIAGVGRTGRLITSAGLIMFLAFVALATTPDITVQMFATGLAVGILIDATIVRALLMPALIVIFGKFNWWIPGPLARLVGVRERPRIG